MSYGTSITDGYRQAGNSRSNSQRSSSGDLPIMQPVKFELFTLASCQGVGPNVPLTPQAAADEVINDRAP